MILGTRRAWSRPLAAALSAAAVSVVACTERMPSGPDDSQLPTAPVTVSLQLAWDEFASNLQVFGGFGRVAEMSSGIVANSYAGMHSRTLVRFGAFPTTTEVRDSTGTLRTDTALTFID